MDKTLSALHCSCLSLLLPLPRVTHSAMAQALQDGPSSAIAGLKVRAGLKCHKTDSWGLGHKRGARFWGFTAKIDSQEARGQVGASGKQPSPHVPGCSAGAAAQQLLCFCRGARDSPAARKASPKQNSPSLLLSQEGQTERTRGRFDLRSDGRSSKKHTARQGLGKGGGNVVVKKGRCKALWYYLAPNSTEVRNASFHTTYLLVTTLISFHHQSSAQPVGR